MNTDQHIRIEDEMIRDYILEMLVELAQLADRVKDDALSQKLRDLARQDQHRR